MSEDHNRPRFGPVETLAARMRDQSPQIASHAARPGPRPGVPLPCSRLGCRRDLRRQADEIRARARQPSEGYVVPPAGMLTIADAVDALADGGEDIMAAKLAFIGRLAPPYRCTRPMEG
jgi:hypothetical protein